MKTLNTDGESRSAITLQNLLDIFSGSFEGNKRNVSWGESRFTLKTTLQCYFIQQSNEHTLDWINKHAGRFAEIFDTMLPEDAGEMPRNPEAWICVLEATLYENPEGNIWGILYQIRNTCLDIMGGVNTGYGAIVLSLYETIATVPRGVLLQIQKIMLEAPFPQLMGKQR